MYQTRVLAMMALTALAVALPVSTSNAGVAKDLTLPGMKRDTAENNVARELQTTESKDAMDGAFFGQYINYGVPPAKREEAAEAQDAAFHGQYINYAVPPSKREETTGVEDDAFFGQYVKYAVPPTKREEPTEN